MHESSLHIDLSHVEGSAFLTVEGDIDAHSVVELCVVLERLQVDQQVVVDMAGVRFMDSSGINALIDHTLRIEATGGGALRVSNPSDAVRRVVELTGLAHLFFTQHAQVEGRPSPQCLGTNGVGTT